MTDAAAAAAGFGLGDREAPVQLSPDGIIRCMPKKTTAYTQICGWIVDTGIECDHQRFCGFLKISLEELLIALRDDRHLLDDPDGMLAPTARAPLTKPQSLYPLGFSADRLIEVVKAQAVWEGV